MSTDRTIAVQRLAASTFAAFGDVLDVTGAPDKIINQGLCGRYNDRARMDFSDGRAGISVFSAEPRSLPFRLDMVERHPLGSQAFLPLHEHPFLVVVAADEGGRPGRPQAFVTEPSQGVNILRNTWHGVLTPLHAPGLFSVVDRIGEGNNLEEFWFEEAWLVNT